MDKWELVEHQFEILCVRDGWLGVWDALVTALWTGERFIVAKPCTVSMWVRIDGNIMNVADFTLGADNHTHVKLPQCNS